MAEQKVLVVDDDEAVRGVVRAALERAGIGVVGAPDGRSGLDALAAERFDVVVLDWHLPGMPGLEVLRCIVRDHPAVPVIVCTGAGDAERGVALAAGAIDHMTKASPLTELVRRVEAVLAGDLESLVGDDDVQAHLPASGVGTLLQQEVAAIAHEVHNHLTVVLGHTDLVRTEIERSGGTLPGAAQVLDDLRVVAEASERVVDLTRRLQDLADPDGAPEPGASGSDGVRTTSAAILLVEDDIDLRSTTERLLREEGYDVLAAADATGALELLERDGPVDLCIADLLIAGCQPGEAAALIAEAAPGTALLVTSGYGEDMVRSSLAPASARFLAKPFRRERLVAAIEEALRG